MRFCAFARQQCEGAFAGSGFRSGAEAPSGTAPRSSLAWQGLCSGWGGCFSRAGLDRGSSRALSRPAWALGGPCRTYAPSPGHLSSSLCLWCLSSECPRLPEPQAARALPSGHLLAHRWIMGQAQRKYDLAGGAFTRDRRAQAHPGSRGHSSLWVCSLQTLVLGHR